MRAAGAGGGGVGRLTLPLADLLLTNLQVVSLNRKDLVDILALLLDHGFGEGDEDAVSTARILAVTRSDWGFEHTIRGTLATLRERIGEFELPADAVATVVGRSGEASTPRSRPRRRAWPGRCAPGWASGSSGTRSPRRPAASASPADRPGPRTPPRGPPTRPPRAPPRAPPARSPARAPDRT